MKLFQYSVMGVAALMIALSGLIGCGGGSNSNSGPVTPNNPGMPAPASKIVFSSNRTGNYHIYTVNPNGSGVQQLTQDEGTVKRDHTLPVLSPNRTKIAYVTTLLSGIVVGTPSIYIMDVNGANQQQLTREISTAPAFSPDGTKVVYNQEGNIAVINTDGSNRKIIVPKPTNGTNTDPSFSPDGRTIIFSSGATSPVGAFLDLYLVNADGTNKRRLPVQTSGPTNLHARFSPDGRKIIFQTDLGRNPFNQISLVNADGSNAKALIIDTTNFYAQPDWSPDGSRIVFASNRIGGKNQLYTANADGTGITRLTSSSGNDNDPDWR